MGSLALRRAKSSTGSYGRPIVTLPSKTVQLVTLDLGPEDAANYAALEDETRKLVRPGICGLEFGSWFL
jgi:SWI/SNF-related matrix-associated actin-dependent regulator of chromatin subfamily A3